jgi:hypothetical protein
VQVNWGEGIRILRYFNNNFVDIEDFRNEADSDEEEAVEINLGNNNQNHEEGEEGVKKNFFFFFF